MQLSLILLKDFFEFESLQILRCYQNLRNEFYFMSVLKCLVIKLLNPTFKIMDQ